MFFCNEYSLRLETYNNNIPNNIPRNGREMERRAEGSGEKRGRERERERLRLRERERERLLQKEKKSGTEGEILRPTTPCIQTEERRILRITACIDEREVSNGV